MKKLKLKLAQLPSVEVLTRDQLKNVLKSTLGGYDGGGGGCTCNEDPCRNKTSQSACIGAGGFSGKCTWQACTGCGYSFYNCV